MPTYIENRKAAFAFEILEQYEAGLVLSGHEVKAIRNGMANLRGSYVIIRGGEAFLVGATINSYQPLNTPKNYDLERPRKLLLSKKQLQEMERKIDNEGLTAIPIKLYSKNQKLKLEVAIARGKKKHDKRESIKARDTSRDIERTLKQQY